MLSTICSSITPRTTSPWISQPFRSYTLSCVKCQAYSDIQRPSRAFYQNMKTYPEVYELFRASNYRVTKEVWAKIRAEPELLRVRQEEGRYHHNIKLRSTDVESRAKTQKVKSAYWQAHKQDDALVRYKYMFSWCFGMVDRSKDAWVRENLPWKSHRPVYQHEPDYRFYTCCGMARYMKTGVSISSSHHLRIHTSQTAG